MVDWTHGNGRTQGGSELVLVGGRVMSRQVAESDPGQWQTVLQNVNLSRGHQRIKSQRLGSPGQQQHVAMIGRVPAVGWFRTFETVV
jgi:hypothetical protein